MTITKINISNVLIILLVLVLFYPTNQKILIDGLILDNKFEILFFLFILPIIFLLKKNLNFYNKKIFLLLVIIKIILIFTPNKVININPKLIINDNNNIVEEIDIFKFENFYINNNYKIITKNAKNSYQLPIEWVNYINPINGKFFFNQNPKEMANNESCKLSDDCIFYDKSNIAEYKIKLEINSHVLIDNNQLLIFESRGVNDYNLQITSSNKSYKIDLIENINDYNLELKNSNKIEKGVYKLSGYITFKDNILSFKPYIIENDKKIMAFDKGIFFENDKINFQLNNLINIISLIFNITLLSYIFLIFYKIGRELLKVLPIKFFSTNYILLLFFTFLFLILKILKFDEISFNSNLSYILSESFFLALYMLVLIFLALNYKDKLLETINKNLIIYLSFFVFLPVIIFYLIYWYEDLTSFTTHIKGNDWHTIQYFAFRIAILNEYLRAGEDIFYFRPLIRYLSFLINYIFGQSFFPNKLIEIWFILMSSFLVLKIIYLNTKILKISLISFFILLFFYFGETI